MHCSDIFAASVAAKNTPLMLGLDPDERRIPAHLPGDRLARISSFCHLLVESCAAVVCGIKIQLAYFEQYGAQGIALVEKLISQAQAHGLIVMMDGKRGDIASTAAAYAQAYLHPDSPLAGDALTINPWLGADSLKPFVTAASQYNRMLFVLVHTSNPDATMFQTAAHRQLTDLLNEWNKENMGDNGYGHVGAVIGATKADELADWHNRLPSSWLLTPGLGVQQGDAGALVRLRTAGANLLVPVSRAILYAASGREFADQAARVAADYRTRLQP